MTGSANASAPGKIKILFVCVENSCRSQMAEGFARSLGAGVVEARSAGSRPSGIVNPKAMAAMAERGIDLTGHSSKGIDSLADAEFDAVVTMGCGDSCTGVKAPRREDWAISDPKPMEGAEFAAVRDTIEENVIRLIEELSREKAYS